MNMSDQSGVRQKAGKHGIKVSRPAGKRAIKLPQRSEEELELAARLVEMVNDLPAVREELVERIRQEIADGTYETQQRLEIAAQRLADELLADDRDMS